MNRVALSAAIGIVAGGLIAAAHFGAPYAGVTLSPTLLATMAAALAFGSSTAAFSLVAFNRPTSSNAKATLRLNEEPAIQYVYLFQGPDTISVVARPGASVGEILVRHNDAFNDAQRAAKRPILLTIRGSSRKPFASVTLQQLFQALEPIGLDHVLLMSDKAGFVGYIPGKRALKEFIGAKSVEHIDKYIVGVLANPATDAVLREIGGSTSDDTIGETDDTQQAEAKVWANENVHGLVIHRKLHPIGYISKVDLLRVSVGRH